MKFVQGQALIAVSIYNSDCIFTGTVVKRTAKTVTIKEECIFNFEDGEVKRCKIHQDEDGSEFIYPHGRYSMAPIFRA